MKIFLLSLFTAAVLFQSGCATHPSIDEQTLQAQQDDQAARKSDAFAKALPQ